MLTTFTKFADRLNNWVGESISWLASLMVLVVCVNVGMRHGLEKNQIWMEELSVQLFATLFLLGAGYALLHERHVRVDVFFQKFSEKTQAIVNLIGAVVFLLPFCLVMIQTTWPIAWRSFMIGERSPEPGGLPMFYVIKFVLVLGFIFILIQAISLAIKSLQTILNGE